MKWYAKKKTIYDDIKRKFAIIPRLIDDEWFWFEPYWEIHYFLPWSEAVYRFKTQEEAEGWVWKYHDDTDYILSSSIRRRV